MLRIRGFFRGTRYDIDNIKSLIDVDGFELENGRDLLHAFVHICVCREFRIRMYTIP